jgi:hypothetical protein
MEMYKITKEQRDLLIGKTYDVQSFFNPIQDTNNDWFISSEEFATNKYPWFATLVAVPFVAKPQPTNL